jgi:hypothetical protein
MEPLYTITKQDKEKYYNNFIDKYKDCKTYEECRDNSPDEKVI